MKAIIISDEAEIIEKLDKTLIESGYDTIIYRWLLKALDNIEEIRADLVIVSANEYPRHWKTLTQFIASGIGGDKTKVFLLTQTPLNDSDKEKALTLGVKGFFSGVTNEGLIELKELLNSINPKGTLAEKDSVIEAEPETGTVTESKDDEELFTVSDIISESGKALFDSESACILFVNPYTGKMITGSVLSYKPEEKIVEVKPEFFETISDIKKDDKLDLVTFEIDDKAVSYKGIIQDLTHALFIKLEEVIHG